MLKYKKLKKITIGKNIKVIGKNAFYNCTLLSEINLPNTLETIGEKAFYDCDNIRVIDLYENARDISALHIAKASEENLDLKSAEFMPDSYDEHGLHITEHIRFLLSFYFICCSFIKLCFSNLCFSYSLPCW